MRHPLAMNNDLFSQRKIIGPLGIKQFLNIPSLGMKTVSSPEKNWVDPLLHRNWSADSPASEIVFKSELEGHWILRRFLNWRGIGTSAWFISSPASESYILSEWYPLTRNEHSE